MDENPATSAAGGGGGPAPFLLKTYDMVDDSATDEIVSWSSNRNSFVVWNPPEFARLLLPSYFKHNNFSSFIRQLNTYGFRKIDPERWEFGNEDFVKDQRHLLKNIHRRKPIHSHSNPQASPADPERAAFEEEIDKLSREKNTLQKSVSRFKQQQPATKLQLENLTHRVDTMEQRQDNLVTFLKKAVQNPGFVEHLTQKLESLDFSAYNKKRRLPQVENSQSFPEDSFVGNQSPSRPEFGNVFQHDFSNKLRLELSPAISDVNLVSHSTQSSNEDGGSPQIRLSESYIRNTQTRPAELSDTGTSFTFNMDSSFAHKSNEEAEGHLCCQLNLSLASSVSQINTDKMPQSIAEMPNTNQNEDDLRVPENNQNLSVENVTLTSSHTAQTDNQAPARVNDVFWEQFLTERPGSSDVEEARSDFRATPSYEQEDRRSYANARNLRNLTL